MERIKAWKYKENKLIEDYTQKDFFEEFGEKSSIIWERARKQLEKQPNEKKIIKEVNKNSIYIFSNGYNAEEIKEILKERALLKIKEYIYSENKYSKKGILDLTNECQTIPYLTFGGSERKKAVLYKGSIWMLKYPDPIREKGKEMSYINNAISEYIGCKVAKEIGLEVQEVELGIYKIKESGKTKVVCLCKSFLNDNEENVPIKTILLGKDDIEYPIYNIDDFNKLILNEIQLKGIGIKEFFWKQFLLDAFICNYDRHDENWGLVRNKNGCIRIAPIYDCGSCLFPVLDNYNLDNQVIQNKVLGSYSFFKIDNKKINYNYFINETNFINDKIFIQFVNNINIEKILKIIEEIPSKVGDKVAKEQLDFYKKCLIINYNKIFRLKYNKFVERGE